MKNKTNKTLYFLSTIILSGMMLMSAGMYFFNYAEVSEIFMALGFPVYIIYPLGIAKVLGVIALWSKKCCDLREWAYAGFFFIFALALIGHVAVNDGAYISPLVAIFLLLMSRHTGRKMMKTCS